MKATSGGLAPPPATWPQTVGITCSVASLRWDTSTALSSGFNGVSTQSALGCQVGSTDREVEVRLRRHNKSLCFDALQSFLIVSAITNNRNVSVLPRLQECNHVVCIPILDVSCFPPLPEERVQVRVSVHKNHEGNSRIHNLTMAYSPSIRYLCSRNHCKMSYNLDIPL
jgi:hypothetical protein